MPRKKSLDFTIDPNQMKVRDELLKQLILGATKSGVQPDQKKERDRNECRRRVRRGEDE
jgi:hypothetical protein